MLWIPTTLQIWIPSLHGWVALLPELPLPSLQPGAEQPPGGWETEAQPCAVLGTDTLFGLRCCVVPPGPRAGDIQALQQQQSVLEWRNAAVSP